MTKNKPKDVKSSSKKNIKQLGTKHYRKTSTREKKTN